MQKSFNFYFLLSAYICINFTNALSLENCHKNIENLDNCQIYANFTHEETIDESMTASIRCSEPPKHYVKRFHGVTRIEWNGCHTEANTGFYLNNFLKDPDPASVVNLTIEAFEMHKIGESEFQGLVALKYLTLRSNNISEANENFLGALESLEMFELRNNRLLNGTFLNFGHNNINELRIKENSFDVKDPFENFTKLRKVKLDVKSIRDQILDQLPITLASLEIRDTDIFDSANVKMTEVHLKKYDDLENLTLSGVNLRRLMMKSCKNVRVLDLSHNLLTILNFSCTFPSLITLKLDSNNIKSVGPIQLLRFPKLRELYLRGNDLHQLDLKVFELSKGLETIDVSKNFLQMIEFNDDWMKNRTVSYKIFIDENPLNCTWLLQIQSSFLMTLFNYTPNNNGINVNGLQCLYVVETGTGSKIVQERFAILISPYTVIFLVIYFLFSVTILLMQTIGYCYQSYLLHKQRHIPFYRTLGIIDNPRGDRRETIQMTMRPLPSLNYEQPIWERYRYSNASSISSVPVNDLFIYEEISEAKSGEQDVGNGDDLLKEVQSELNVEKNLEEC